MKIRDKIIVYEWRNNWWEIKRNRRVIIIISGIAILFVLFLLYIFISYYFSEERRIINYAMKGSRRDFKLDRIKLDKKEREIQYFIIDKDSADVYKIGQIRLRMNDYLEKHPKYFLNEGYRITLSWCYISGNPKIISFTNKYAWTYNKLESYQGINMFVPLDCMVVERDNPRFDYSNLPDYSLYDDLKGIIFESRREKIEYKGLINFNGLKYIRLNGSTSAEEEEEIIRMFPDCKIYGLVHQTE